MKKLIMFTAFILLLLFSMVCLYGDDMVSCWGCNGSGNVIVSCQTCGGAGGFLYNGYYMICNTCKGTRGYLAQCPYCKGTGKVKAPKSAPGQNNPPPPQLNYPFSPMPAPANPAPQSDGNLSGKQCTSCHGTGKCYYNYSYGFGSCNGTGYVDCHICNGSGSYRGAICTTCKGTKVVKCPQCGGSGKCKYCNGTGKR